MNKKNTLLLIIFVVIITGFIFLYNSSDRNLSQINNQGNKQDTSTELPLNTDQGQDQAKDVSMVNPALLENSWQWTRTIYSDGAVIVPTQANAFIAAFNDQGQFSSSTDCNNTFGQYTLAENNGLSFGPLASTLMFCENSQESEYAKMLANISSYMIAENGNLVLMIKYDSGSMIFVPTTLITE